MSLRWIKAVGAVLVLGALASAYWLLSESAILSVFFGGGEIQATIERLGLWGPFLVVGLMTVAVVLSPIPSAPVALAAGAAYGHLWGTVYVLIGAEMGALIAFGLARFLGYDLMRRWFGDRLDMGLFGSQRILMATVFLSRLMPFISFDIVSYAAGLTALTLWRFALATFAGIVPASFLLAHFGGELASSDADRIVIAVLLLGAVTGVPFLLRGLWVIRGKLKTRQDTVGISASDQTTDRD